MYRYATHVVGYERYYEWIAVNKTQIHGSMETILWNFIHKDRLLLVPTFDTNATLVFRGLTMNSNADSAGKTWLFNMLGM